MDLKYSKKELKKLKKLGLTDNQIEQHRIEVILSDILQTNCDRLSVELGKKIVFGTRTDGNIGIFLLTDTGRYCEFLVSYKDVICDYRRAFFQIKQELTTRFYYL